MGNVFISLGKFNMSNFVFKIIGFCVVLLIGNGCASFGKGVTEAILEKQTEEDTRRCEIRGDGFQGLKPHVEAKGKKMKVLMVHGVGDHTPGYSTEFFEKLAKELNLNVTSRRFKNISLTDPKHFDKQLGNLRVVRFLNKEQTQELMFYELSWSEITRAEKQVLEYDNSGEYSFRRAEINDLLKKFSNDTGPDPIIYLGESREDILTAFSESFCWMSRGGWDDLPDNVHQPCDQLNVQSVQQDSFALISHSLGSRITIDGLQRIAAMLGADNSAQNQVLVDVLKNKQIPIYMMSNQLPMLQLGRKLPAVRNKRQDFCVEKGSKYHERILARTPIIAFSDPNDLLSYAIQHDFVDKYLDPRLCIDVTNININVATVFDVFGMGKMANPMEAHIGYDTDDRVIALIAKGIGNPATADIVKQRCHWMETID